MEIRLYTLLSIDIIYDPLSGKIGVSFLTLYTNSSTSIGAPDVHLAFSLTHLVWYSNHFMTI